MSLSRMLLAAVRIIRYRPMRPWQTWNFLKTSQRIWCTAIAVMCYGRSSALDETHRMLSTRSLKTVKDIVKTGLLIIRYRRRCSTLCPSQSSQSTLSQRESCVLWLTMRGIRVDLKKLKQARLTCLLCHLSMLASRYSSSTSSFFPGSKYHYFSTNMTRSRRSGTKK